jgi:hypothetical protein
MDPTPAISAAATNIAAAVTASAIASLSPRNTIDDRIPVARVVGVPVSSIEASRDPVLRRFEDYLCSRLRQSDIIMDNGIWLFNVNQVAYLAEGCETKEQQKATKRRIRDAMNSINIVVKKCARTGNGKHISFP